MALFKSTNNKSSEDVETGIPETDIGAEPSVADIVAPPAIEITGNHIQVGAKLARTFFVFNYPRYLNTNWFSPIINTDRLFDVAMFVHPTDTGKLLKELRSRLTQVQSQISMETKKGKVRDPVLETARQDIESLRDKLVQGTEKFFRFGLYITIYGNDEAELNKIEGEMMTLLDARLTYAKPAVFQHREGFESSLPIGRDKLFITTSMNSSPLSTSFPFVSSNLTADEGILYGINRHNNSLVLFDRFNLENANMVIFGTSGGGKSYAAKLEVLRSLMMGTEVILIDPENEYEHLAESVDGSLFRISLTSDHHINPFDLSAPLEDEDPANVLRSNIVHLVGLLRIMLGETTPEEDSLIDRALTETYALKDITPESDFTNKQPPLMSDFQQVLENMEGGASLARRLERYTAGTFEGFLNRETNVSLDRPLVVFGIRDMEDELRPIAVYLILHHIWNRVRSELKKRLLVIDEAWWLMQKEDGASFLFGIAKRARKYYLGLTTITQDIPDFMSSPYGKPIVTNAALQMLFKQSPAAIDVVKETFNLSDEEKYLLLQSEVGEGIFFAGLKHVAIKVVPSYTEDQIITSDPQEILEVRRQQELAEA